MVFPAQFNLANLDGNNGFVINGIDPGDNSGFSVSNAGDVNGDGIDDLIIGAYYADPDSTVDAGSSYVVFGSSSGFNPTLELSALDGANGFVINGIDADDLLGNAVSSAGDVNGDGIDDLIIGAYYADPNGIVDAGENYVVFGSSSGFSPTLELSALDGANGFVINGIDAYDTSGIFVSSAGDVNGDGIDDLIIGADYADPDGKSNAGESYVVFGSSSGFTPTLELSALDGNDGFVINGVDAGDLSGNAVSNAGDVNGDGIDDLIIGAYYADPDGSNNYAGSSYVVFGSSSGFTPTLELSALDGANGFVINGIDPGDSSGISVSSAGDVNGDGIDDLIIGADYADPDGIVDAGESYVVFGSSSGFTPTLELSALDGANGFVINGINEYDFSGRSVSSGGDVNGDGIDDLIIGASGASPDDKSSAGESYVVFGMRDIAPPNRIKGTRQPDNLRGTPNRDFISGDNGDDTLEGLAGDDTIEGDRGGDLIRGGDGNDVLAADRVDRFDDFDGTFSELRGGDGNDTIFGGRKNDLIGGGKDDDVLLGKRGDDTLRGSFGDDLLNGGIGNDTLRGQDGIDTADYSDLTFAGVFGTVAGLDVNLAQKIARHSSNNNPLTWTDTVGTIENVIGTSVNDRFIGDEQDNLFDGRGEVNRNDRRTTFTDLDGDNYQVIADVVEYSGNQSDFTLSGSRDSFTVSGADIGTDTLDNIEFLKFDDGLVTVDDSLFA